MHNHDLDLMAALADGSLTDETEARALLAHCEECRTEYTSQVHVRQILRSAPSAAMTGHEKAALHRDLWGQVRRGEKGRAPSAWWYRWAYAAAGLFVVVGLVSVLNQSGVLIRGNAVTETFGEIGSGLDSGGSPLEGPTSDGSENTVTATGGSSAEGLDAPLTYQALADAARKTSPLVEDHSARFTSPELSTRADSCLERAGADANEVIGEVDPSTEILVTIPRGEAMSPDTVITLIDFETCEIVHIDG